MASRADRTGDHESLLHGAPKGRPKGRYTSDAEESFLGTLRRHLASQRSWQLGVCCCCCASSAILFVAVAVLVPGFLFQQPTWEVTKVVVKEIDIPALLLEGLVPADTSLCPANDPCGVGRAKGCSKCPQATMWNDGCVCKDSKDTTDGGQSAPAGTVIQANKANCPHWDRCGLVTGPCTTCPDSSWVNDGCFCRQEISPDAFFRGLDGFIQLLSTNISSLLKMRLWAEVRVDNPNPVGANTDVGLAQIRYRDTVLGSAAMEPRRVDAHDSATFTVFVSVDSVPADVAMQVTQDILLSNNELAFSVVGRVPARVGVMRVLCQAVCKLSLDVLQLPRTVFTGRACQYTYDV